MVWDWWLVLWGFLDGLLHPERHRQKIDLCVPTTTSLNGQTMKQLHYAIVIAATIMSYFSPAQPTIAWAVCGAGDTVLAALVAALLEGNSLLKAARHASSAARRQVNRLGVVAVPNAG